MNLLQKVNSKQKNIQRLTLNQIKWQFTVVLIFGLLSNFDLTAQPSGGPYGPMQQFYNLPKTGLIYYVSPEGKTDTKGHTLNDPTTIEAAFERVKTGDAIILRGGIYRTGDLKLNQGITMQPYGKEKPILKGTKIATEWEDLKNGLWRTKWSQLFPSAPDSWWRTARQGIHTPLHRFNDDMVFVNGNFLQSAGWQGEVTEDSYYIDYDQKYVYIAIDPSDKEVEITAFSNGLYRTTGEVHGKTSDKKGPIIRGITFTQYVYRALEIEGYYPEKLSNDSEHGKDVTGTTIEHCTFSYSSRVGVFSIGDNLTMRNCKISGSSMEGLYIVASDDVLIEKNIFTRNNIENLTGYYPSAVKIFNQSYRVTCNDNLVIDHPNSNGIWYDVGNVDGVFTNNWIEGVGDYKNDFNENNVWPSRNAFFFEISRGVVCTGNVFVNNDHGILILNSAQAKVYNNTFVNSMVCFGRNERSAQGDHFGWHPSTGPDVQERVGHEFVNNLLTSTEDYNRPQLFVWQREALCKDLKELTLSQLNNNVYVKENSSQPLIWFHQSLNGNCKTDFNTPTELNKLIPNYSGNSRSFINYNGPLFKGSHVKNYKLLKSFSSGTSAAALPKYIKKYKSKATIGAYESVSTK